MKLSMPSLIERGAVWRDQQVFLNDSLYVGRITQADAKVRRAVRQYKNLAMMGTLESMGAFEAIRMTMQFESITPADIRQLVHYSVGGQSVTLRLVAVSRTLDGISGTSSTSGIVTRVKGRLIDYPLPNVDNQAKSVELAVHFLEIYDPQSITREPLLLIDVENGIYRPDKNDAQYGVSFTL